MRGLNFAEEKITLLAISIDPKERSKELIAKIEKDGKGKVNFPLLSDPGHKTVDSYGLFDPEYIGHAVEGIPHPAVYLLDKNRKVVWVKIESDYRKRPSLEEIRAEIRKMRTEM